MEKVSAVTVVLWKSTIGKIKLTKRQKSGLMIVAAFMACVLFLYAYTEVVCGIQKRADEKHYNQMLEEFKIEYDAEQSKKLVPVMTDEERRKQCAEIVSKVLYGVKDNSTDDLRTYCWCVFNRVDNPAFPSTIEDVVSQPNQWMRYSEDNPVLESIYGVAFEEVCKWFGDGYRPCTNEFVYMSWTPNEIVLRDTFVEKLRETHYWKFKE